MFLLLVSLLPTLCDVRCEFVAFCRSTWSLIMIFQCNMMLGQSLIVRYICIELGVQDVLGVKVCPLFVFSVVHIRYVLKFKVCV